MDVWKSAGTFFFVTLRSSKPLNSNAAAVTSGTDTLLPEQPGQVDRWINLLQVTDSVPGGGSNRNTCSIWKAVIVDKTSATGLHKKCRNRSRMAAFHRRHSTRLQNVADVDPWRLYSEHSNWVDRKSHQFVLCFPLAHLCLLDFGDSDGSLTIDVLCASSAVLSSELHVLYWTRNGRRSSHRHKRRVKHILSPVDVVVDIIAHAKST